MAPIVESNSLSLSPLQREDRNRSGTLENHDTQVFPPARRIRAIKEESRALRLQREHIARDLHDGVGSHLTHIVSRLEILAHQNKQLEDGLMVLRDLASETINQLRETIWVLHQEKITFGHLTERIRGLILKIAENYERIEIRIAANGDKAISISPFIASSIFRIIQESINNSLKYAGASVITVCLNADADRISTQISDDGKGFDLCKVSPGYGITNMQERAKELGGKFYICSSEKGTHIMVYTPVSQE